MGIFAWLYNNWFELAQTAGIVGSLLLAVITLREDEKARRISNHISITERYNSIWRDSYHRPELARILSPTVDLERDPVTGTERLFVTNVIFHLDTVRRASKAGLFIEVDKLGQDINRFFALPIPKAVWDTIRDFQNRDFIEFIESHIQPQRG